ncbi:Hypothetical protein Spb1_14900 [Planctopirus ephydatiae]|uniref:Ribonuclease HIII n=1 Tax=Planctopirus ephydatiae TaxID=2528019 RepID=A0A518GLY1_9PLAN|nr:hypothetical protein [Planctopirus ephydatiae]QDV29578.1 Hypothetical protein Spb1_14900 [Planctopirus ephydatiae]
MNFLQTGNNRAGSKQGRLRWIGLDEAGLGPNLGPLVITATVWETPLAWWPSTTQTQIPQSLNAASNTLWESQSSAITQTTSRDETRLHIADSKAVYSTSRGLDSLAASVNGLLHVWHAGTDSPCKNLPANIGELVDLVEQSSPSKHQTSEIIEPWFAGLKAISLPGQQLTPVQENAISNWLNVCREAQIELTAIHSRVVMTPEFNRRVKSTGNKSTAVSEVAFELMQQAVQQVLAIDPDAPILLLSDQHGGRKNYEALLVNYFPDAWWKTLPATGEGRYYLAENIFASFAPRSESYLPVAAASLVCKYLRECYMHAFNRWWLQQLPKIKPTQGYPQDARRFRAEIDEYCQKHQLEEDLWWRCK